ncbi:MAG: C/D box methylation guide ribonucleoprotein complex aNOP56 subunit [Thermoprotei archaeon]|nr:MAG: C/D box methylation guide ribonucleoprotein complex aNOP56 subunit [Thermoprotei archaeon]
MRAYLVETIFGIVATDEKGNIIDKEAFPDDKEAVADKLIKLEEGDLVDEVISICKRLKEKGVSEVVVENAELARRIAQKTGLSVAFELPSLGGKIIRERLIEIAKEWGKIKDVDDYISYLQEVGYLIARKKVRKAVEKRDLLIAQAISAIDEIDRTLNLFASRIREWYSLHFPELNDEIRDHRDYIRLVYELGLRNNFVEDELTKLGVPPRKARIIAEKAKKSMGADIADFDLEPLRALARIGCELYELRNKLRSYVDEAMKEVAPNIRELVGPLLGARLIALAGGLQKLATLPASTIQVLGAEKALFRALRTGGKPPKHGVIFQFPAIHRAPRWQRGKIARALAAKLAIAARLDAFTGEFRARELKEMLEKRIEEIKRLYAKPPPRKRAPARRRPPRRGRRR